MKKLLALLLSGMMLFSFAACGGEEAEDTGADSDVQAEVETDDEAEVESEAEVETVENEITYMYLAFGNMDEVGIYNISDVVDVTSMVWTFAGGMADGVQFTEEEHANALTAFGGTMYVVFNEDGTAQMVQGGGTLQGKYQISQDNALAMSFDNNGSEVFYACAMTVVEEIPVLMAYTDETYTNGIYLIGQ